LAAPIPVDVSAPATAESPVEETPSEEAPQIDTSAPTGQSTAKTNGQAAGAAKKSAAGLAAPILLTEEQKQQSAETVDSHGWREGRKAIGVREEMEQREEEGAVTVWWRDVVSEHPSWAVSMAVHVVIGVVLALWTISLAADSNEIIAEEDPLEDVVFEELELFEIFDEFDVEQGGDIVDRPEPEPLEPDIDNLLAMEGINSASQFLIDDSEFKAPENDILSRTGTGFGNKDQPGTGKGDRGTGYGLNGTGGGMGGRGGRRGDALGRGATPESEQAVNDALKWLADHQMPDGGWSFHHHLAPTCLGKCPNSGDMPEARVAATALGVLPFLGAGQTHQVGKYQRTVAGGLTFLMRSMDRRGCMGENGGRMYSHGLATIALCEAYGMQVDDAWLRKKRIMEYDGKGGEDNKEPQQKAIAVPGLGKAAQAALNFVVYAQDPVGGGWRYEPRQAGDTSVVGWQLMGLMSGRMAYLRVPNGSMIGANAFLNHVQMDDYGSDYGYTDKGRSSKATQAIGLLCRMYLGWAKDHQGIIGGVQDLNATGPVQGNMYYNYYATQVMKHFGGEPWKAWNPRMRDSLVNSQSQNGHTKGSWHFAGGDRGASKGGRLYCTAMSAMTLMVYYRHMPLYREGALEQGDELADDPKQPAEKPPKDDFKL